jgi:tRNA 2-thiocytidine biosynthesis protein TtcA
LPRWAEHRAYPIIPCDLCGSQENLQRQVIKKMLHKWDTEQPGRVENIARSLRYVVPSHLGDAELFDFASLSADDLGPALLDVTLVGSPIREG